mmetsp:Transcript_6714/g.15265  ORF Transcript_6714/g.15265 Transcript_6714/m.15265 type:complete len:233 (+) Transcript_6714:189-887(+)
MLLASLSLLTARSKGTRTMVFSTIPYGESVRTATSSPSLSTSTTSASSPEVTFTPAARQNAATSSGRCSLKVLMMSSAQSRSGSRSASAKAAASTSSCGDPAAETVTWSTTMRSIVPFALSTRRFFMSLRASSTSASSSTRVAIPTTHASFPLALACRHTFAGSMSALATARLGSTSTSMDAPSHTNWHDAAFPASSAHSTPSVTDSSALRALAEEASGSGPKDGEAAAAQG